MPALSDENSPSSLNDYCLDQLSSLVQRAQEGPRQPTNTSSNSHAQEEQIALGSLVDKLKTPRPFPELPCYVMEVSRQRNKDFHGRESVLAELEKQLLTGKKVAVVSGIGGLGKSEVALEFAHRQQMNFDATFWIPANDIAKMRQSFGRIPPQLKLGEAAPETDPHMSREIAKVSTPVDPRV